MKRFFTSLLLTFLGSASFFVAAADKAGFWSDNAATLFYTLDGAASDYVFNASGMTDIELGTVSSFVITKTEANVWKRISENIDITAVSMFYRINSTTEGEAQEIKCDWMADLGDDNGSRNQKWGKELSVNITDGLADGDYTLSIWYKFQSSDGDKYLSNGSKNYNFKFTINSSYVEKYYIAGNGIAGSDWCCGKEWDPAGCELTEGKATYTSIPAGQYSFKITNGTWNRYWGYTAVNASCSTSGYSTDSDGNVVFNLAQASDITIAFTEDKKICLTSSTPFTPVYSCVPSECPDVMMQGFYWNSYSPNNPDYATDVYGDTRWKSLLSQADEIGAYFDLIWLPPSALASGTGYYPRQYSNQNSDWGSRADLEKLIATFHNSGTKVVADIVLDHLVGMASWCDFATNNFGQYGTYTPQLSWICNGDEINDPAKKKEIGDCGKATGPDDEGDNNIGARDLAHSLTEVQDFSKAYLKWMINEMHFDGFRWDEAKGFDPAHIGDYNRAAKPYISFMERWSGNDDISWAIERTGRASMALDFQTKYSAFDGIAGFDYSKCKGSGLLGMGYAKYAVTFIDSHDWFLREEAHGQEFGGYGNSMKTELKDRLLQANAFLLSMPGVPSVFYPHWAKYKEYIKPMINARHLAGVHSESKVSGESAEKDGYECIVEGKNGKLKLQLGNKARTTDSDSNFKLIASGNGYSIWVSALGDAAPRIIATQSTYFEDNQAGIDVTIQAVGGSGSAVIYYTTDGTAPTTESAVYTAALNFKETTTLKVMAACGEAQSAVQTYTYTYREPLARGIQVRFRKPDVWNKVYFYAWLPGTDEQGNATSENIVGAYPGQRIYQDADGWFTYEFDSELKTLNFCINSGDDCGAVNVRSNDLEITYDACYGWKEGQETEDSAEELLDCSEELNPAFDLSISPESGSFSDVTEGVEVKITAIGKENAMIYYTTDGTEPTNSSASAQGSVSFKISASTTVKAYAFDPATNTQTEVKTTSYIYKAPQSGPITVNFIKPEEWTDLYLYAFTRVKQGSKFKDTPFALDGKNSKWPGMKWTNTTTINGLEWYTWTMGSDIKEIYIIFTEGDKKPQTQDIYVNENTCYVWNPDCGKAVISKDCDGRTDIETISIDNYDNKETYKIIVGDQMVIIRDGVMYDVLGRRL